MTPERAEKLRRVAALRQPNLTVILENVHDLHNIGAVMRSCDSVGVGEIFVLYNHEGIRKKNLKLGKRTSAGTRRWVDVHFYLDTEACFEHIRSKYDRILCTHLGEDTRSLYDLDLTTSVALLFGNEHEGITEAALAHADGNFLIPQVGMAASLNISVACAVSLYEAFRQRQVKGFYDENLLLSPDQQQALFEKYVDRHQTKYKGRSIPPQSS